MAVIFYGFPARKPKIQIKLLDTYYDMFGIDCPILGLEVSMDRGLAEPLK